VVRWPLQPLQPLQKTQLQPPFGSSVDSLSTSPIGFIFLKLPPTPCAVLLVCKLEDWKDMKLSSRRIRFTKPRLARATGKCAASVFLYRASTQHPCKPHLGRLAMHTGTKSTKKHQKVHQPKLLKSQTACQHVECEVNGLRRWDLFSGNFSGIGRSNCSYSILFDPTSATQLWRNSLAASCRSCTRGSQIEASK
jgi:hypothetical protein